MSVQRCYYHLLQWQFHHHHPWEVVLVLVSVGWEGVVPCRRLRRRRFGTVVKTLLMAHP